MGLFDFFKRESSDKKQEDKQMTLVDNTIYLLDVFKKRLVQLGYQVSTNQQYPALIVNSEIEIATAIINNPNNHPSILHVAFLTVQDKYFPNGIEENIVGLGTTFEERINSVIDNYITTTFTPIIGSLSCIHDTMFDFHAVINGKELLWHSILGSLTLQGKWEEYPKNELLFEIVKDKLKNKLTSNKLNWLKFYISKQTDGTIIGECLFNNEPWKEGLVDITGYAKTWNMNSGFHGLKQFIMFRRCDAYDE